MAPKCELSLAQIVARARAEAMLIHDLETQLSARQQTLLFYRRAARVIQMAALNGEQSSEAEGGASSLDDGE
eukprot:11200740-Heterocapsa_arctica.AAC.1